MGIRIATLVLVASLVGAGAPALAGDLKRFPEAVSKETEDAARVEGIRDLLRQAHELQQEEAQREREGVADGEAPVEPGPASPDAPKPEPAEAAGPAQVGAAAGAGESQPAGDEADEEKPVAATRSGCMYRGDVLIWEKVPGTCR